MQYFSFSRKTLIAWVLLVAGVICSILLSFQIAKNIEADEVDDFSFVCDQITLKIQERLGAYALILQSGAGFFSADQNVDRKKWRAFVETMAAKSSIAGVQGVGFSKIIAPEQLVAHTESIRKEGFPDYSVRPLGERPIYSSIIYLEPFTDRNLRAFGYDMFSEPIRRVAMERARDTGVAALSGKVELVQETGQEVQAGTLMYYPVYRHHQPIETVEDRRAAILGWVYSPYRMNDLLRGILGGWKNYLGGSMEMRIYDEGKATPNNLLFESKRQVASLPIRMQLERKMDFAGHSWLLVFDSEQANLSYTEAWLVLGGGIVISSLLCGLLLALIQTRNRATHLANEMISEIRLREELLQTSEYRWRFAVEGTGDGLWDWNIKEGTVFYSKNWKAMLGYEEGEIGTDLAEWSKRVYPEDLPAAMHAVQAHCEGNTPLYHHEHRIQCKDGTWKWIQDRGLVVARDTGGKPLRMIGRHSDITLRKLAEAKLRESENLFRMMSDSAPVLIWMSGVDKGCFYFNKIWLDFTGRTLEQESGNGWTDGVHPEDAEKCMEIYRSHFDARKPFSMEYRLRRADGEFRWLLDNGVPRFDENGNFFGYIGSCLDITERNTIATNLRESERQLKAFIDFSYDLEYLTNTENRLIFITPSCERITGYTSSELMADPTLIETLIHPEDREKFAQHEHECHESLQEYEDSLQESLECAGSRTIDFRIIKKDGSVIFMNHVCHAVYGEDGKYLGRRVSSRDITERKLAEVVLKNKNAEIERFIYTVSHDLKSPLITIKTFLKYLEADVKSENVETALKDMGFIRGAAEKMGDRLDGLLALAKAGREVLHPVEVPLQEIIQEVLALVAGQVATGGVQIVITEEPILVYGDKAQFVEVFQNLVDNAVKFCQGVTMPRCEIGAECVGGTWEFFVRDNGRGIAAEHLERVFGVFQKLDATTAGSGIGLALVKRIIETHGGTIRVESEGSGQGTTFRFTLPVHTAISK